MQWQFSSFVFLTGRTLRRGGKKWRFPFGRELTTCWRLFRWRGGLACATVNKLKCWEVQWVSGAPSKAVPKWHTAFDVLAKFVFSTATTHTKSAVHELVTHTKKTHLRKHTLYVIWTCSAATIVQRLGFCSRNPKNGQKCTRRSVNTACTFKLINQHYFQPQLFQHPWPGRQRHWHL